MQPRIFLGSAFRCVTTKWAARTRIVRNDSIWVSSFRRVKFLYQSSLSVGFKSNFEASDFFIMLNYYNGGICNCIVSAYPFILLFGPHNSIHPFTSRCPNSLRSPQIARLPQPVCPPIPLPQPEGRVSCLASVQASTGALDAAKVLFGMVAPS